MNRSARIRFIGSVGFFLLAVVIQRQAAAQQPAVTGRQAVASAAEERKEWTQCLVAIKGEKERTEASLSALSAQLVALDESIAARVDRLVGMLSSVRDSTDTGGVRIRKSKEDALDGLKAAAKYYAQQRDMRKSEMLKRNAKIDPERLAKDVDLLNARIEVCITQSLVIASSLAKREPESKEKYRYDNAQVTAEWNRSKRAAQASVTTKNDLLTELRASIDKLNGDIKAREQELAAAADPRKKEALSKDIETMRKTIAERKSQIEELLTAPKPDTSPIASKAAFELDKLTDEMTAELKKDFVKFKGLVAERDVALIRLKSLENRQAIAKAALDVLNKEEAAKAAGNGK